MGRGRSVALAGLAVAGSLGLAVGGALLTRDPTGGVNRFLEGLSSGSTGLLASVGNLVPLGFAFGAGLVAAVNPCGFVLLPTYLVVLLGEGARSEASFGVRLRRGLLIGLTLTAGFVLLFAAVGLAIASVAQAVVDWLPWLGLAVGVALIVAGGYRLAGGSLYSALPERLSARLTGQLGGPGRGLSGSLARAERNVLPGLPGYFFFGLAYGLASLSCTLPIFLAVLGGSLAASDLGLTLGRLVLYGFGMGTVVLTATLVGTLFSATAVRRMRRAGRFVEPAGTVFLFAAGAYVVYYWLTIGGLLGTNLSAS